MRFVTREMVQRNNPGVDIPDEEYREIEGYGGWYYVSNYGNVMSLHNVERGNDPYQSQTSNKVGYFTVGLWFKGKGRTCLVHRLVAEAFLPKIQGKSVVNHKDCNKHNCFVGNLEWCTQAENVRHAVDMRVAKYNTGPMLAKGRNTCYASVSKPVLVIEHGKIYPSSLACGRALDLPWWYVSKVIRDSNGYGARCKLHFKYVSQEEYNAWLNDKVVINPVHYNEAVYKDTAPRSKCVRIVETGECFSSSAECDAALNTTPRVTSRIINTCGGYYPKKDIHLEYISKEEYFAWLENPVIKKHESVLDAETTLRLQRSRYCVKIVETGECFVSSTECDERKGFRRNYTSSTITRCGGHRKTSPYHFVKITADEYIAYVRSQSNK